MGQGGTWRRSSSARLAAGVSVGAVCPSFNLRSSTQSLWPMSGAGHETPEEALLCWSYCSRWRCWRLCRHALWSGHMLGERSDRGCLQLLCLLVKSQSDSNTQGGESQTTVASAWGQILCSS